MSLRTPLLGSLPHLDDYDLGDRFDHLLKMLPTQDAPYFTFDAAMLSGLLAIFQFTADEDVIPSYWSEWVHARTFYPIEISGEVDRQFISFVRIRRDSSELPRLDDTIWMGHEVGHQLLLQDYDLLIELFQPAWQQYNSEILHASMNTRGHADVKLKERQLLMEHYWSLESGKTNWTHELVIDTLCVWVFGPAYVWAFLQEHLSEPQLFEPHQLDTHPPRRIRTQALQQVARELDWREADDLQPLLDAWQALPTDASESNLYTAYCKAYLIAGAQRAAIQMAEHLGIPRLTRKKFDALDPYAVPLTNRYVRDLILSAWKQRANLTSLEELERWESEMVNRAITQILDGKD
ncbi:hypothetical protein [Deinococcus soli (ex Cha et al. 2016)]|uniref:hypothetical protein n=1 Tax=Deinococcus soli (ex Cha et al. 2016) TaxID=1309411 RepID=UPI001669A292|nr:hypothetical protein [Deinococcus soli (ex Cha et al. 2016)]